LMLDCNFKQIDQEKPHYEGNTEQSRGGETTSHLGVKAKSFPVQGNTCKVFEVGMQSTGYLVCLVSSKESSVAAASVQERIEVRLQVCCVQSRETLYATLLGDIGGHSPVLSRGVT
jgi:hypothetical protein